MSGMVPITERHVAHLIDKLREQQDISRELLEALKAARIEIKASGNWDARDYGWPAVRAKIEAAIAKAEASE